MGGIECGLLKCEPFCTSFNDTVSQRKLVTVEWHEKTIMHDEVESAEEGAVLNYLWKLNYQLFVNGGFHGGETEVVASETLVSDHQTTRHNNPENRDLYFSAVKTSNYSSVTFLSKQQCSGNMSLITNFKLLFPTTELHGRTTQKTANSTKVFVWTY